MKFDKLINLEAQTIKEFNEKQTEVTITKLLNDSYSHYDFEFTSGGTKDYGYLDQITGICEAKTRSYSSTKYNGGILIELAKFSNVLTCVASEKDVFFNINKTIKGFYLVKYTDKTFLFDLETLDTSNIIFKKCPKHTASDGFNGYITKAILLIPPEAAILTY